MRKFVAALFLAALAACGDNGLTDPNASIAGNYSLRTVNGTALPYTLIASGAFKIEITDDAYTINDNGTYTETGHTRTTSNGQVTTETIVDAGTYTRNGTAITLRSNDGTSIPASLNGSSITIVDDGISAVYSR